MPELRIKEVRLPELRLPEMSRDDISRVIDDARDQISEIELPDLSKVDLSKVEMPRIDLSKIDLSKVDLPKAVAGASFIGRRAPRRWPFVVGGIVAIGVLTAVVVSRPPVQAKLRQLAHTARMRFDERKAEMEARREGAHAFDAAVAVPIQPSVYADDAPASGSPFDGSDGLPDRFGADQAAMPPAEDATRV
jgi:hypothetical protein